MLIRGVAAGAATVLMTAGCGVIGVGSAPPAKVSITPANGTAASRPEAPIVVRAITGKLGKVTVQGAGGRINGTFDKKHKVWTSNRTLTPATKYTVTAVARSGGNSTTSTSSFQTLTPKETFGISDITPMPNETLGVGMPLIVTFDKPVENEAAVERALKVTSDEPVEGAWHWFGREQAVYRTKAYWQPHQNIRLTADLAGVRGAQDTYGTKDYARSFKIGDSHISTVDTRTHQMTVQVGGKTVRTAPISAGRGGATKYTTTNGVHAVMGKQSPVTMTSGWDGVTDPGDPNYYSLTVYDAVQISSSGEYVHAAPWSVGSQGHENVSHGCVNASPAFAQWFYALSQRGDIVKVTGTDRELEPDNGYGYWQLSWADWLKGSALHGNAPNGTS